MQRVLIGELDSPNQARIYQNNAPRGASATAELIGMIRTGVLLSERVLVTDSMLLDGIFFYKVGPDELLRRLGHTGLVIPLTVITHFASLDKSLEAKLADDNFIWQLRTYIHSSDGNCKSRCSHDARWRPPQRVNAAWRSWLDAADSQQIEVITQSHDRSHFSRVFSDSLEIDPPQLRSHVALDLAATAKSIQSRSRFLEKHKAAQLRRPTENEITAVYSWWMNAYLDALAEVNDADWLRLGSASAQLRPLQSEYGRDGFRSRSQSGRMHTLLRASKSKSKSIRGRRKLRISGSMIIAMTNAPPAVFSTLYYATAVQRRRLAKHRAQSSINTIAYSVRQHLSITPRWVMHASAWVRFILALLAALLGLPVMPDKFQSINISWILAVVALVSMPWVSIWDSLKASRVGLRGLLSVSDDE